MSGPRALLLTTLLAALAVCALAEEPAPGAAPPNAAPAAEPDLSGPVWYIRLQGDIDPWVAKYFVGRLDRAERAGAGAIVVEITSNGGLIDSMMEMSQRLIEVKKARTIAYVVDRAFSAGTGIALACDTIYMNEGATIGSALPFAIGVDPETNKAKLLVTEKMIAAVRGKFRALAEQKGHSTVLAEAMVDPRIQIVEAKIDGERTFMLQEDFDAAKKTAEESRGRKKAELVKVVCQKDQMLDLTSREAEGYGLAAMAGGRDDFLKKAFGEARVEIVETEPSSWEKIARFLSSPALSAILVVLAVIALMIEIKTPALGIGGATFLFFIGLFFWSKFMAGQSGPVEIIFFLIGVILVALEIFVIPGFGVPGIAGISCMGLSLILSFVPESAWPPDFAVRPWVKDTIAQSVSTGIVTIAIAGVAGFAAFLALKRLLPHAPLVSAVFLPADAVGGRAEASVPPPMLEERAAAVAPVGAVGTVESDLHPSGKALFGEVLLDVVTEGDFVARGAKVRVLEVSGNRVVVTRA